MEAEVVDKTVEALKIELIQWVVGSEDTDALKKLYALQQELEPIPEWHKEVLDEQSRLLKEGKLRLYTEQEAFAIIDSDEE